jgi:FMN phosphatase YigB (HAD superfamily)
MASGRSPVCQVRVVTFDLDNTLWNTTVTIDIANDALAKHMSENIAQFKAKSNSTASPLERVEVVMGKLFTANKSKYCPVDGELSKSPVLLTKLRKDAILYILSERVTLQNDTTFRGKNGAGYSDEAVMKFVDSAFDVWTNARHAAISSYMAPSATQVLQRIQSLPTAQGTQKIVIGAVTDGNSDPSLIPELSQYFDFCINAEIVGVSKPNKRIYLQAVLLAMQQHQSLHDLLPPIFKKIRKGEICSELTEDQLEELVGPWWVHVGDDFVKDIVASKSLNMRSIWTKEFIVNKLPVAAMDRSARPQRTVEELMQVINEAKIVEMPIGADNYLADSLQQEFADAMVDQLQDVADIIQIWQVNSLRALKSATGNSDDFHLQTSQSAPSELQPDESPPTKAKKFCIACGTKLPMAAKFCASCGQKQSDQDSI